MRGIPLPHSPLAGPRWSLVLRAQSCQRCSGELRPTIHAVSAHSVLHWIGKGGHPSATGRTTGSETEAQAVPHLGEEIVQRESSMLHDLALVRTRQADSWKTGVLSDSPIE